MPILTDEIRKRIESYLARYPSKQAVTLPALHIVHEALRCVPREAIVEIADLLDLSPAEVHDTITFYGFFRDEDRPLGKKRIWVCRSLACALRGGEQLLEAFCQHLKIRPGQTTADGEFSLEFAECLGGCEGAPCILIDDECRMNVRPEDVERLTRELKS